MTGHFVAGERNIVALGVVTGDGAALSKAGELLLDAVGTDGSIALARLGNDGHFALKGDVCICSVCSQPAADACAANNDLFLFSSSTAADRFDGGTAVRIAS